MALKTQSYKYKDYRIDVEKKKDYCLQLKYILKYNLDIIILPVST